ncbi:glycoside hydrolase family 88 protein [Flavivirga amylovorans]|uniref:Glycoside hydrolase family 88 protein n=1 Tax=Flavivirga amylovorans TaxID=870486 RepID=A0ABT8WZG9_9FLAO|nr:glycoside hydrolase family 88 protein [Flavivirga amylovorans]MDO5987077.1 glycoside hydrolase family 88 protein [Flavivirga amylovorans]
MNRYFVYIAQFFIAGLIFSCKPSSNKTDLIENLLKERYDILLSYTPDSLAMPRSYSFETEKIRKVPSKDWTSGFYPGNLWLLYKLSGNESYKHHAKQWTAFIEKEKHNDKTHDMGFKVFCSFGQGLKHTNSEDYKSIIIKSAKTLSTRFNDSIGCIRSWDFNKDIWQFPVIIDNMMNLELLFEATKLSQDSTYHNMAIQHANTTLKNHFRDDHSIFHVIDYDTISYQPRMKVTHQGLNDLSVWARGQAWGIYGYTMAYRYTKDSRYLKQAEATATFYLNHKKLRDDGIPYWDFHDPEIPNAPRDVSAATIVAAALVELYGFTKNKTYLNYSKKVVEALKSEEYILETSVNAPFILKHSTGNWPKNDEVDVPIIYADYYFLETLLRLKNVNTI